MAVPDRAHADSRQRLLIGPQHGSLDPVEEAIVKVAPNPALLWQGIRRSHDHADPRLPA